MLNSRDYLIAWIDSHANLFKGKVIDAGCGGFRYLDKYKKQCALTIIDKTPSKKPDVILDIEKPLPNQFIHGFDLVLCNQVLEHTFNPVFAFNNIFNFVSKNGGTILFSVPWMYKCHGTGDFYRFTKSWFNVMFKNQPRLDSFILSEYPVDPVEMFLIEIKVKPLITNKEDL